MRKPPTKPTIARADRLPVFDSVKLDLAVAILIALAATLVIIQLNIPQWAELLGIAAVGVGNGVWVVLRTQRVVRTFRAQALESMYEGQGDDP
ncbi:MAG TPA: hypothetical protein VFL97_07355 [Nitrococcus sp.]|nr:hypothetical protein [Nitrococcus sp.]